MTDAVHWNQLITNVQLAQAAAKEAAPEAEKESWNQTNPNHPASSGQVKAVEDQLGFSLDAQHAELLRNINGWTGFDNTSDLLSTDQLFQSEWVDAFNAWFEGVPDHVKAGDFGNLLPITVDKTYPMYYAMVVQDGRVRPEVVMLDPTGVVEVYPTIKDYLEVTAEYARLQEKTYQAQNQTREGKPA